MPIEARRVYRLSLTVALALAASYALQLPMPFLAPLFAFVLAAAPAPPIGPKGLLALILVILITLGGGLVLVPLLAHYTAVALVIVALGLFFSNFLTVNLSHALFGTFLTIGFTLISAAGLASYQLATTVIQALVLGIALTIISLWVVYPWFPEDAPPQKKEGGAHPSGETSMWIAARATIIVFPAYLLALYNPQVYMPIVMKAVSLGQQGSVSSARHAGRELLGSTFLGGCFAVLFWFALKMFPSLWMFFLWMLLFALYFASKQYGLLASRFPASFWQNTAVTLLILLGPAVEDSANGKDVYMAFTVRMALIIAVTLYAWLAIRVLEAWRLRRVDRSVFFPGSAEVP